MAIIEGPSDVPARNRSSSGRVRTNSRSIPSHAPSNSYGASTSAVARAFRAANDEDAKRLSESGHASEDVTSFNFYMVPSLWMDEFHKYIKSLSTNEEDVDHHPGKIENTLFLLECNDQPDDSVDEKEESQSFVPNTETRNNDDVDDVEAEEHERRRQQRRLKWKEVQTEHESRTILGGKQQSTLKPGLVHREDFVLVGENVWTLLSYKFGYDLSVPLKSVTISRQQSDNKEESSTASMGVEIYSSPKCVIPIPASGKWDYNALDSCYENQHGDSDLVSEDDDQQLVDLFPIADQPEPNNQEPATDDTTSEETSQVLLLPNSTTANSTGRQLALVSLDSNTSDHSNNIYPTVDDMEYDNDANNKDSEYSLKNGSAQPEPNTNKRKRYGSGLGNLGNTCFMNSTLQCLAHTDPLRNYFVSGNYEKDLNRDNPLGTGGELATEFADLLSQMWGIGSKQSNKSNGNLYSSSRNGNGYFSSSSYSSYSAGLSSVVYPRNFKYTLGKHAEQFMGYDQHDSQELATYLLDALHEDTNRITKKPYIEKPEQEDDESDDAAAEKAWELHTKRDDSRVMESFMGQVKSRVQCPVEGCGRVSTTFDPFMYLSVPIPGATDRTMVVTYVPLDPKQRMRKLNLTLSKMSAVSNLRQKIVEALSVGSVDGILNAEDICLADVWSNEVYTFYKQDDEIDKIRDTDATYAYELRSVSSIRCEVANGGHDQNNDDDEWDSVERQANEKKCRQRLGLETITKLNENDGWMKAIEDYFIRPVTLINKFNAKRSTHEQRMDLYEKINKFVQLCHKCPDSASLPESPEDAGALSDDRSNDDANDDDDGESSGDSFPPSYQSLRDNDESFATLAERSEMSSTFKGVETPHDLAILEFCCRKFRQFIDRIENEKKNKYKDGCVVQVVLKRHTQPSSISRMTSSAQHHHSVGMERTFATPLVVRISPQTTVAGFRELIGIQLSRALKPDATTTKFKANNVDDPTSHESGQEPSVDDSEKEFSSQERSDEELIAKEHTGNSPTGSCSGDDSVETNEDDTEDANMNDCPVDDNPYNIILRQIPLTYERKSTYSYSKSNASNRTLGSLVKSCNNDDGTPCSVYAKSTDDSEQGLVAGLVGNQGTIFLHWPENLSETAFDDDEWETVEETPQPEKESGGQENTEQVSVLDCISKYCQMEQLEDSDKWYCNRCKDFVPAFKQFHLYRTPPILIVHLKRFHFSSTTHRRDKIDTFIDFPLTGLDLTGEVMHWREGEEPIYDCYAVSNHYGGLGGGHYTAYARGDDSVWCHFDDSRVTTGVNEEEVVSSAAYVLYYRRRDVDIGDIETSDKVSKESESSCSIDGQKTESTELCSSVNAMDVEADVISGDSSRTCSSPMDSIDGEDLYGDAETNYYSDGIGLEENPQSQ